MSKEVEDLDKKRRAYKTLFESPQGKEVLKDLAQFCGMHRDCFNENAIIMAHNTGLRKAFLRIQNMLNVTDQQIWEMFEYDRQRTNTGGQPRFE